MRQATLSLQYLIVLVLTGCSPGKAQDKLSPAVFDKRVKVSGGCLIDVRTRDEFNEGHLQGAVNIDFYDPGFRESIKGIDKAKPVFIYCRSGSRSAKAAAIFKEEEFIRVYELKGGIVRWIEEQLLTVK